MNTVRVLRFGFFLPLVAALLLFVGCTKEDEDPPPTPELSNPTVIPSSPMQGTTVLITVRATISEGTLTDVSINLSNISATTGVVPMYDDGTNGDPVAGDRFYSLDYALEPTAPVGAATLTITATSDQGMTASTSTSITVVQNQPPVLTNATISRDPIPLGGRFLLTADASDPDGTLSSVTVDLTPIGGAAGTAMYDDGANGDVAAGDGTYSLETTVPLTATPGTGRTLQIVATDSGQATATASVTVDITSNTAPAMSNENVTPAHQIQNLDVLFTVTVTDSDGVASVVADLTPLNGPAAQAMVDNGTSGDVTAGDDIYSLLYTLPANCPVGVFPIFLTATDTLTTTNYVWVSLSTEANAPPPWPLPRRCPIPRPETRTFSSPCWPPTPTGPSLPSPSTSRLSGGPRAKPCTTTGRTGTSPPATAGIPGNGMSPPPPR
jgi:hypothetical protein